jgi:hypothetical protein
MEAAKIFKGAFHTDFDLKDGEKERYLRAVAQENGRLDNVTAIAVKLQGQDVDLSYQTVQPKFERIRRITGYLVGTVDRWNNAKQAELRDRVKHA